jgi:acetyl-CoA acetyltransferase family protein
MSLPNDAYIVGAIRSPIGRGRSDGALNSLHPVDLLAETLSAAAAQAGVPKNQVEDLIVGCVTATGEQGTNIARLAGLKAGFPIETPGVQVNRYCGSGQQAIHFASQAIAAGDMDLAIGAGIESMSRVAIGSDGAITDEFRQNFPYPLLHQGVSAEMLAEHWKISRTELDEYAAMSHARAAQAAASCWTSREINPMTVNGREVKQDEGVRANIDPAKMASLQAVFKKDGVITAGNSSQISDGAAAVILASGRKADELGLKKRARIVTRVVIGSDPAMMLTGPIEATRRALAKAGLTVDDIDAFEINEAFASVVLAWARELKPKMDRVNIQGGAIAHGHPLGATGAVLMTKLVNILERTGGRYGLQSMCEGFGMANATIIERLD